jgi:hypothetical protein
MDFVIQRSSQPKIKLNSTIKQTKQDCIFAYDESNNKVIVSIEPFIERDKRLGLKHRVLVSYKKKLRVITIIIKKINSGGLRIVHESDDEVFFVSWKHIWGKVINEKSC